MCATQTALSSRLATLAPSDHPPLHAPGPGMPPCDCRLCLDDDALALGIEIELRAAVLPSLAAQVDDLARHFNAGWQVGRRGIIAAPPDDLTGYACGSWDAGWEDGYASFVLAADAAFEDALVDELAVSALDRAYAAGWTRGINFDPPTPPENLSLVEVGMFLLGHQVGRAQAVEDAMARMREEDERIVLVEPGAGWHEDEVRRAAGRGQEWAMGGA